MLKTIKQRIASTVVQPSANTGETVSTQAGLANLEGVLKVGQLVKKLTQCKLQITTMLP